MSIVHRIAQHAEQTPEKLAVVFEGREVTYAELWDKTVRLAHLFKGLGVSQDDRVVFQGKYDAFFIAGIFASHLCGAAAVPADKDASAQMLDEMANRLDARLVVSVHAGHNFPCSVSYGELAGSLPETKSMEGLAFPEPDSVAEVLFTTGTTGAPKGVLRTQLSATTYAIVSKYGLDLTDPANGVMLTMIPLNHVAPIMILERLLYEGGTMIFLDGMMKVGRMFEYMERYGVNSLYFPPSGISLLQKLTKDKLAKYANQIEYFTSGSAALTAPQREYMKQVLPQTRLYTTYASSEAGMVSIHRCDNSDRAINCCGKPSMGVELRIMDDAFQSLPTGQVGLVAVKSDMLMKGYYKRPELTDAVLHEGYFISGDLGYLDDDGYLYICGRSDDMINIGGLKVFPSEIENAALRIPGVQECICFSVPDPVTGQGVKLLVKPDETSSVTIPQVQEELTKSMDYYKVPKSIELVTEIQKTANGKPNRKFYQDQAS